MDSQEHNVAKLLSVLTVLVVTDSCLRIPLIPNDFKPNYILFPCYILTYCLNKL